MQQEASNWRYTTTELHEGYWQVKIVHPDKSNQSVGGFDSQEEAETWVVMWKTRKSSWARNGKAAP